MRGWIKGLLSRFPLNELVINIREKKQKAEASCCSLFPQGNRHWNHTKGGDAQVNR